MDILLGAHTSIAGGVENALYQGQSIGASTIQLFTANQRQWASRPLTQESIDNWKKALEQTGLKSIMSHDSYLINLGCPNPEILAKSRSGFREEVIRCLQLGLSYCNFHPGCALEAGLEKCLDCIVESILQVQDLFTGKDPLRLLIETTAGQGSTVGAKFEEISYIIERVKDKIPIGVCIDTCHVFVAGYDIRTKEGVETMLSQFDSAIGLEHLYAFHLNDSVKELGTRVDRHADIGKGCIGIECFKTIMQHPKLMHLPKYLETPGGPPSWKDEILLLKSFL